MKINVHIFHHWREEDKIKCQLNLILQKLNNMPTKLEFEQAFAEANEATNNIAADIDALLGKLESGLSEADAAEVLAQLKAHSETLKGVASKYPDGTETPPVG